MNLPALFRSSLFLRLYSVTALAIVILFAVLYSLSVPYIQRLVETMEERSARTVLSNVVDTIAHIHHSLENNRQAILLARKMELHHLVQIVESRAARLELRIKAGEFTRAQAKERLLDEIRRIQYGNNDYVWAANYQSVLVAHPDPKLNNADFSQKRDTFGHLIVPPMVAGALANGAGYYSYWWRRLGEEQPIEKLSYYKHLPSFDLVIGTGVYIDDIERAMQAQRDIAIEQLREQLRKTRLAKTGYVYVFDSDTHVLIHPNPNLENKKLGRQIDPISKKPLAELLMAAADHEEGLRYKWDSPADPGNYVYEKISWVRHFQPFNWYVGSSVYVAELDESARTLRNRVLVAFAATLLLALALVYLLVKKIVAPLRKLSQTALEIQGGNLQARCTVQREDEIGVVATAFNEMVDRLHDSIQHLDAKVAARTAELEEANEELKKLDQLKSDFISTVSHELRTPMTSIIGFAKLVRKKLDETIFPRVADDEKTPRVTKQIRDNLGIMVAESERLTLLINDVLDSAKLEAGKVEWHHVELAPHALLERARAVSATLAEQKGLTLTIAPDAPPAISGDENRLLQVLINLISNAVKFTPAGHIALRAEQRGEMVVFSVADNGIGIPFDSQEDVFEKFRQIGNTLTDKPQGTGLGLSICKQIVKHHGGQMWLESEPGKGSTFYFSVPIAKKAET